MLFVPEDDKFSQNPLPSDIPIARDGFVLLGSPVVLQSFCSSYVSSRVRKINSSAHWSWTTDLINGILNGVTPFSPYLFSALESLSVSANRLEWSSLDNIDFPICQHYLSRVVDQPSFNILTDTAPKTRSKALSLSSVYHNGDCLKVVSSKALGLLIKDCDFRLCLRYWLGVNCVRKGQLALFVRWCLMALVTIRLAVRAIKTSSIDITPSGISFSLLPNQLL